MVPHTHLYVSEDRQAAPAASSRWPTVTSVRPTRALRATVARWARWAPSASWSNCSRAARATRSSTYIWANATLCRDNMVFTAFLAGRSGEPTAPAIFVVSLAASSDGRAVSVPRDAQHRDRISDRFLHRVTPFRVVIRVVRVFRGAICHSFLICPAFLHPAGRAKQNRRPRLWGPPAWCRLWRRRASVNDAPCAVIPP